MYNRNYYLVGALVSYALLLIVVPAWAGLTDEYNHNQNIEFQNNGNTTIKQPLQFTFNSQSMIDYGYINPDASDVTIDYLGHEEYVTACNLSGTQSQWRTERVYILPDHNLIKTLWFGNSQGTRNQAWIASGSDVGTVTSPGSFAFTGTESFSLSAVITPVVDPGTEQIIFGKGNNYRLSLATGPQLWFSVWDSVTGLRSTAALDVTVGYDTQFIAWFDGGYKSLYCCSNTACGTAAITNLLTASGSVPIFGQADIIINDFAIRTTILPIYSGTIPGYGSGTPTPFVRVGGAINECDTEYCDFNINSECFNYSHPLDENLSLVYVDANEGLLGDGYTHRYAFHPDYTSYNQVGSSLRFTNINYSGSLSYYSDDQILTGVSVEFDVEDLSYNYYHPNMSNIYFTVTLKNDSSVLYPRNHTESIPVGGVLNPSHYTVYSGTYTLSPSNANWTVGELKNCQVWITANNWIGLYYQPGIDDEFSCYDVTNNPFGYIQDVRVTYKIADN